MGAPRAVALCQSFGGELAFQGGDWQRAERELREAIDIYKRVRGASGESLSLQRLGVLLTARGRLDEGLAAIAEAGLVAERALMRSHCMTRAHASATRNRLAAKDLDAAEASLAEGIELARRHGHCLTCNALLLPETVRVRIARGDLDSAEAATAELEAIANKFGSRAWVAMSRHARGRVEAARGARDRARVAFEDAATAYEAFGSTYHAARCRRALADVVTDPAMAEHARRAAADVFRRLGAAGIED
jgi:ATP/maltotriose-dependent transcriptional regulator MalT